MATTYLTPGVYIEEVDKGTKPIQGVPTAITAFIGFTQRAEKLNDDGYTTRSILGEATMVTNWGQYKRHFGDLTEDAYLPYSVRGFFDNGGSICHVISVRSVGRPHKAQGLLYAKSKNGRPAEPALIFHAKDAGISGNKITVKVEPYQAPKAAATPKSAQAKAAGAQKDDKKKEDEAKDSAGAATSTNNGGGTAAKEPSPDFQVVVTVGKTKREPVPVYMKHVPGWNGGGLDNSSESAARFDDIEMWSLITDGKIEDRMPVFDKQVQLTDGAPAIDFAMLTEQEKITKEQAITFSVAEGADLDNAFKQYSVALFEGDVVERKGIASLDAIDNVNLVCAPDVMMAYERGWIEDEQLRGIQQAMLDHCKRTHYRFAILDAPPDKKTAADILDWRMNQAGYDSMHGALYYPWIKISDPVSGRPKFLPPSGFMAGIYARSDDERGVHKAPANEVIAGVIDIETNVTKAEQSLLNPNGINCIRKFSGRGIRVWGARTLASDPAWRYINVRRLFNYVEESVERSTQWIVFEPNDHALWAKVRRDLTAFLRTVWLSGALFGQSPEKAFYVKCDEETNLPELRDLGQMVCEIGMAPVKPAEFVIFRFSQWASEDA